MQTGNPTSLAYLTVAGSEPVEMIEAAAEAGFDYAGLRLVAPRGLRLRHDIVGDAALVRRIRQACDRTGVQVLDVEVFTLAPDTDMASLRQFVETSAELGASILQGVCEDPDRQRAVDRFGTICDMAAPYGMKLALEFMRWRNVATIEDALAFVTSVGRPNATICIDTLHLSRSGGGPGAVQLVPPEQLPYVQLCDAVKQGPPFDGLIDEARNGRLYPGEGALWLDEVMDALPPGIPISLEVPRAAVADRSVHERAKLAGDALRGYLARYHSRESRRSTSAGAANEGRP